MKRLLILLISIYQKTLSPDTGLLSALFPYKVCRYHPTCSEYTKQSIQKYGVIKGSVKGSYRVLRCNPWSKGGYDPVD